MPPVNLSSSRMRQPPPGYRSQDGGEIRDTPCSDTACASESPKLSTAGQNHDKAPRNCRRPSAAGGTVMKSAIAKRSVVIAGHKTSISLEDAFWECLRPDRSRAGPDFVSPRRRHRRGSATRQLVLSHSLICPWLLSRACARDVSCLARARASTARDFNGAPCSITADGETDRGSPRSQPGFFF